MAGRTTRYRCKFRYYWILQRHRAVPLSQHGFHVGIWTLRQPHCRLTPPPWGTPANIRIYHISLRTRIIDLHFAADKFGSVFIYIFLVGSIQRIVSAKIRIGRSRSSIPSSLILVLIESAYATSYHSVIVNLVLSCTVSENVTDRRTDGQT